MSSDRDENGAGRTSPDVERSGTEQEGTGEFTTSPAPSAWYTQGVPPPSTGHNEEAGTGSSQSGSAMPPLPNGFTAAHAPAPGMVPESMTPPPFLLTLPDEPPETGAVPEPRV